SRNAMELREEPNFVSEKSANQNNAGLCARISWHVYANIPCKPALPLNPPLASDPPGEQNCKEKEVMVTVDLNPLELKLLRRAIARAADEKLIDATAALNRICALDALRWEVEEDAQIDKVRD